MQIGSLIDLDQFKKKVKTEGKREMIPIIKRIFEMDKIESQIERNSSVAQNGFLDAYEIVDMLPDKATLVDVTGGTGAIVLLSTHKNKVFNETNSGLLDIFKVLKDEHSFLAIQKRLEDEFTSQRKAELYKVRFFETDSDFLRAYYAIYTLCYALKTKPNTIMKDLDKLHHKLKRVEFVCMSFKQVIQENYLNREACLFVDLTIVDTNIHCMTEYIEKKKGVCKWIIYSPVQIKMSNETKLKKGFIYEQN